MRRGGEFETPLRRTDWEQYMRFSAVIFDLDGTLLDTLKDIADSANRTLAEHGMPTLPLDDYLLLVGEGVARLFERAVPESMRSLEMLQRCGDWFRDDYSRNWDVATRPYDDADRLLQEVSGRGIKMSVLSNKPHNFTQQCVSNYFPGHQFELVIGQSDDVPAKPDPTGVQRIVEHEGLPLEEFLFLGDTGTDMQTAVAANVYPVGALWGFRTRDELIENGAQELIAKPLDLLPILDGSR
jgi:phosphoglycolate phosphatase